MSNDNTIPSEINSFKRFLRDSIEMKFPYVRFEGHTGEYNEDIDYMCLGDNGQMYAVSAFTINNKAAKMLSIKQNQRGTIIIYPVTYYPNSKAIVCAHLTDAIRFSLLDPSLFTKKRESLLKFIQDGINANCASENEEAEAVKIITLVELGTHWMLVNTEDLTRYDSERAVCVMNFLDTMVMQYKLLTADKSDSAVKDCLKDMWYMERLYQKDTQEMQNALDLFQGLRKIYSSYPKQDSTSIILTAFHDGIITNEQLELFKQLGFFKDHPNKDQRAHSSEISEVVEKGRELNEE